MFWNLFGSHRPAATYSRPSFRPRMEVLEDRTVPAMVPSFAAVSGLTAVVFNPALANANTLLNNQLVAEFALLPTFDSASASQLLSSALTNPFQLASLASIPNVTTQAFTLFGQESLLSTDMALLILNPALGSNAQFTASVNSLAAAIHNNPLFLNPAGFVASFAGSSLMLNQELSAFFASTASQTSFGLGSSPGSFGTPLGSGLVTTPLGFAQGVVPNGFVQTAFGFGATPSGLNTIPFNTSLAAFGFGSTPSTLNTTPSSASLASFGFGSTITL